MPTRRSFLSLVTAATAWHGLIARAQERFSPFVGSNPELVQKSNAAARAQGLADRARFVHQNAFDADLGKVDVIFMWLFPELMRLLRPKILAQARAGTRVVTATWDLGTWQPDAVDDQGGAAPAIRKWIVPARMEGAW